MQILIGKWPRYFTRSEVREIAISCEGISIVTLNGNRLIPLDALKGVVSKRGLFWCSLALKLSTKDADKPISIRGIGEKKAVQFVKLWSLLKNESMFISAAQRFEQLFNANAYFTHYHFQGWMTANGHLEAALADFADNSLPRELSIAIEKLQRIFKEGHEIVRKRNTSYVDQLLNGDRSWFDSIEKYPLTRRQRGAIAIDENNCLVVAGAGTGKTSVVIGKVGHLLRKSLAKPKEILLLAFTRKAREEIEQRIKSKFKALITVRTFHSLGLEIIGAVDNRKPSLSVLAEDDAALTKVLNQYLNEILKVPHLSAPLIAYFADYLKHYRPETDFSSLHEYSQYLKSHDIRSLKGEKVKSYEEAVIANFLFINGVAYDYEKNYQHETATAEFRQYRPDFYLSEYDIYLEHFGVDRRGNTAPWVDKENYWESIDWKRKVHAKYGTTLIETWSYQYREGTLSKDLTTKLLELGVKLKRISQEEITKALHDSGDIPWFVELLKTFLNHFKGCQLTLDDLRDRAKQAKDKERLLAFIAVFEPIYAKYTAQLRESGEIDFHDMIIKATEHVTNGHFKSIFKYVIVDEFQDISWGRYRLLKALLDQIPDRRLLCVGDDWQSIYRFAGSDVNIMTSFEDLFGYTEKVELDRTFRFSQELVDFSNTFIMKNHLQICKNLTGTVSTGEPAVKVLTLKTGQSGDAELNKAFADIDIRENGSKTDVLVIGRYNHTKPKNLPSLKRLRPSMDIGFMTAHSSKGLESDYAIVLDLVSGKYGFPTEITDDPVLNLFLSKETGFANAEERRLLYVAVTRARKIAYLITHETFKSSFIEEIEGPDYEKLVQSDRMASGVVRCSRCGGGLLVRRAGKIRPFWGCGNYPYCEAISEVCLACNEGVMLKNEEVFKCNRIGCEETAPICPGCGTGMLIMKDGKYGPFLGCTNYRVKGLGCRYTRNLQHLVRKNSSTRARL
jgi:DNA helicase IV